MGQTARELEPAPELGETLHLLMRGQSEPVVFNLSGGSSEFFEAVTDHLRNYGFKGWRQHGNVVLNMGELQAFWINPIQDEDTDT